MPHPYCPLAQSVEHSAVNRSVVSSSLSGAAIFVVRKSYNRQKAQDIAYLVLFFCYYILCFCRWTKSLNLTAAFRRFFQKTGLELTTYRFCSIGERNKWLAENCDMMIVYIKRDYGGAYKCYKHAQELGVPIMNIADNIKNQEW
ncbi:putative uncharacterized protein [Corallococcus sp. CAG:1435]|nr:putative uncharacterized protein [Corallococcus sp. CAG:1435]